MIQPETILIVDDEAQLRMNLRAFMEDLGYRVLEAAGGQEALVVGRERLPDLIMLDINMPGMNGFEVCAGLRAEPATAGIPVLFLSALLSTADKLRAFACGGIDYVTKPFQLEEVQARVEAHLQLRRQRRQLQEQHAALQALEALRDSFTHMVAHDMRGPLAAIIASVELSLEEVPGDCPGLRKKLEIAGESAASLSDLITQMLELSRMESHMMPLKPCLCDVAQLAEQALAACTRAAGRGRLLRGTPEPALAWCDPAIITRVLGNLLGNAVKVQAADGSVRVTVTGAGGLVRVAVSDDGPGIAPQFQKTIFDKFVQTPGGERSPGLGLGLAFCRSAVEAHQGEIGLDSAPGAGSTFWFTLPAREP